MTNFPNRGYYRGNRNKMLQELNVAEQSQEQPVRSEQETPAEQAAPATSIGEGLTTREAARAGGYTGDQCTNCNSLRMKFAGHCLVCEDCGTTTGCS